MAVLRPKGPLVVDAHSHIFPAVRGRIGDGPVTGLQYGAVSLGRQTIQVLPPLNRRVEHTPEMLLAAMAESGVDRAVLLQGPFYGHCNKYVGEALERYQSTLSGAVGCDPWQAGRYGWRRARDVAPAARAFKLEFSERTGLSGLHPGKRLDDDDVAWLWQELDRSDMVAVIDLGHIGGSGYQTEAVRRLALRHPRLQFVIAHLSQPNVRVLTSRRERAEWLGQISLGVLPNVAFDLASLPAYFDKSQSYRGLRQCLRWAVDTVGPAKLMWGSDIPAMLPRATYGDLFTIVTERLDFLTTADRAQVTGGNALRLFWKPKTLKHAAVRGQRQEKHG
jgi:predicted TIM-barrel fold metal-dependent hydrolase